MKTETEIRERIAIVEEYINHHRDECDAILVRLMKAQIRGLKFALDEPYNEGM